MWLMTEAQAIVAEHDRSAHAERQALLKVLRQLRKSMGVGVDTLEKQNVDEKY